MATTTVTNSTEAPKHFSLDHMSAVLMDRKAPPVGFFVSQKLWDSLEARWRHEGGGHVLGPAPVSFHGLKIAIDPSMPDTEFDVVLSNDAWSQRLHDISQTKAAAPR